MNVVERLDEEDPNQEWLLNFHREIYSHIIPFIKNKNILDIACGFGYATNLYIQNGASSVTGVDISEETINEAKRRYNNKNINFLQGNAENLEMLPSGSFDIVTSVETIEHVENYLSFIREVYRLLKKDGVFFLSTPNRLASNKQNPYHVKEFSFDELKNDLENNGFKIIKADGLYFKKSFNIISDFFIAHRKLYKILFFLKKTFVYKIFLKFVANPKIENNLSNCTVMVIAAKKFFNT